MWYNLAYANGNSDTRGWRRQVEERMTLTQVDEAQRVASAIGWRATKQTIERVFAGHIDYFLTTKLNAVLA